MADLFDFVYYRLSIQFMKQKDDGHALAALFGLSFLHYANVVVLFTLIVIILFGYQPSNLAPFSIVSGILIVVLNGIRYNKLHFEELDKRYGSESATKTAKRKTKMFLYIILTIASTLVLIFREAIFS